jgi:hypothetical protein
MLYKPDWAEAQDRFAAWWNHESRDRVTLSVSAPRENSNEPPTPPDNWTDWWTDAEWRLALAEHHFESNWFGGEAFPYFDTNIGPGSLAMYLGSEPSFHETTVWYNPIAERISDIPELRMDPENRWWLTNRRLVELGMERGEGKYLTSFPDIIENLDVVASLVGTQPSMYEVMDNRSGVIQLIHELNGLYFDYYDNLFDLLEGDNLGTCFSAFSIWGPGRVCKVQCDAAAMLSAPMFDEIVVPGLIEQTNRLDYSVFHLDGPDCVQHIDALARIPGLNAIQWTPGAAQPSTEAECWWPMYRKILDAGKGLLLLGADIRGVEALARQVGRDGVLIGTTAPSVEFGENLLRKATTW